MNQDEFNDAERESKFRMALIEGLQNAKPCCGEYTTCMRACTPRGRFLGARDAKHEWVGLTSKDIDELVDNEDWYNDPHGFAKIIEAKVKEKNDAS